MSLVVVALLACLLPAAPPPVAARGPRAEGEDACVDGLRDVTALPDQSRIKALTTLPDGRVMGVGSVLPEGESGTALRILTATHDGGAWTFEVSRGPNESRAGLQALAISRSGVPWAAGVRYVSSRFQWPLVVRRVGGVWQNETPTTVRGFATSIATDAAGRVWAATVENTAAGPVARLYGRRSGTWTRATLPSVPGVERYVAIAAPTKDRTFAAGSTVTSTGVRPVILARSGSTWRRERVDTGVDHVVLTGLIARPGAAPQAAGWTLAPGKVRPLLLRRAADGVWRPITITGATGAAGIVTELVEEAGRSLALGGSYLTSAGQWVPAVGDPALDPAWRVVARPGWFVQAATGDPSTIGWAALGAQEWRHRHAPRACLRRRAHR